MIASLNPWKVTALMCLVCLTISTCLGLSPWFMAYVFAMEFGGSLPWCGFLHMLLLRDYRLCSTPGLLMLFLHWASGGRDEAICKANCIHSQMLPTSIFSLQLGNSLCFSFQRFHISTQHKMIIFTPIPLTLFPCLTTSFFFPTRPLLLLCVFSHDPLSFLWVAQKHGRDAIYWSMNSLSVATSLQKMTLLPPGSH